MSLFRRILAPTDFSASAETALRYAVELAAQGGAQLRVLHVIEDPRRPAGGGEPEFAKETASLQAWFESKVPQESRGGVQAEFRVIHGYPAFAIPRHAMQEEFDLIVMGTHGRGDQPHASWGSVAEKVVGAAACPVLTIRQGKQQDVARERLAGAGAGHTA